MLLTARPRLDSALARLNANSDSNPSVAQTVERRHVALALLLTDLKGEPGSAEALTPSINRALAADTAPAGRIEMVRVGQEALLKATDNFAKSRIERLRLAFRMAGLTPSSYMDRIAPLGGPLIESSDPAALAAVLDVDEEFASRIQRVGAQRLDRSRPHRRRGEHALGAADRRRRPNQPLWRAR